MTVLLDTNVVLDILLDRQPWYKKIDITKVESIAGIHVGDDIDVGKVQIGDGTVLASVSELCFTVTGKGAHASSPGKSVDPVVAAANLVIQMHTAGFVTDPEALPTGAAILTAYALEALGWITDNMKP
jgi:metal-dependent amidase/aminoacylase/carboxypeptidase family protein